MSRIIRSLNLLRASIVLLTTSWLAPVEIPGFGALSWPVRSASAQYPVPDGQEFPIFPDPFGQPPGDDSDMPRPGRAARPKAARKKARGVEKEATKKADARPKAKAAQPKSADAGSLKFAQDIAPILVANCGGCHKPGGRGLTQGKLDLTTFENLQKGTPDHKVVVPGKPAESSLVLRIKGEETPQMPLGNNRSLSGEAIAKIEQWVKSGAALEAGVDPKAAMASYAASPEQMRRNQLAKTPASERDKKVEAVGLERWKQANAKVKPEVVTGEHFLMFSNLPKDRATSTVKALEAQYSHLRRLLGSPAMDWPEKVGLYVFSTRNDFVEFVRSVERRDADPEVHASANLRDAQPYIAAVDPAGGKREEPAGRRRARGKRAEEPAAPALERSLLGVLTDALGTGSVAAAGNAPRWLRDGIGAYMASKVEPHSPYYRQLRQTALANYQQGWPTKANEALGDGSQVAPGDLRAIGFALIEAMMAANPQTFPTFLHGMLAGTAKLDETLEKVYGGTRDDFLKDTGDWIAETYGDAR
jgi:mono/diheme cytochrome c family protein